MGFNFAVRIYNYPAKFTVKWAGSACNCKTVLHFINSTVRLQLLWALRSRALMWALRSTQHIHKIAYRQKLPAGSGGNPAQRTLHWLPRLQEKWGEAWFLQMRKGREKQTGREAGRNVAQFQFGGFVLPAALSASLCPASSSTFLLILPSASTASPLISLILELPPLMQPWLGRLLLPQKPRVHNWICLSKMCVCCNCTIQSPDHMGK